MQAPLAAAVGRFGAGQTDQLRFLLPVVPFAAAYVLLTRPPWFKTFVDGLYDAQ